MSEEMSLKVTCPVKDCGHSKDIKVPSYVFQNKAFGTLKIQIHKGIVCPEHQFVIFVDKKGKIRGYEKIDLQLTIAKKPAPEEDEVTTSLSELTETVGEFASLNIFHAFLLNVPIVIFVKEDSENLKNNSPIQKMIKELFLNVIKINEPLRYMKRADFKNFKMVNTLAIDEEGYILSSPWEINKFDLEQGILEKALETQDFKAQGIIFRQAVSKLIKKVEFISDFIKKGEIYEEDIKSKIRNKFLQKKVTNYDVDIIKEILKFRYSADVSKIKIRSFDKLKESLW